MGVERRVAVRADDPQVLDPVVMAVAVDVVEDQRHAMSLPDLVLAAQLAPALLEPFAVEPLLQRAAAVRGPGHEDLFEWLGLRAGVLARCGVAIEVIDRDRPDAGPLLEHHVTATGGALPEVPERLGEAP
jgi:hypothetical protein